MTLFVITLIGTALVWWAWENARRKTHPVPAGHRSEIAISHEREFELYHNAFSLCSMKTRVCLAELGVSYKSHHIDLIETGAYENVRREFLAVNPGGTVPVLVHAGHPIYESHEQIRYAAAHAPPGRAGLVPEDARLREEMEYWIDRSSITEDPLNRGDESAGNAIPGITLPIFAAMIERIPYWKIFEGLLFHFDKRRPLMFILFKMLGLRRLARVVPAMKILARSRTQLGHHLDALEKKLRESRGPWILGEAHSLADVSWLVIFERLVQVDGLQPFVNDELRPECAAYWSRLRDRPSYRAAILDYGHPIIRYGTERIREAKAADPRIRSVP